MIFDHFTRILTRPTTGQHPCSQRDEVVGIINADDQLEHGALLAVQAAFAQDPELDFVCSDVVLMDEGGQVCGLRPLDRKALHGGTDFFVRDWRFRTPFPHPALFVRRRVYDRLGGYDLRYRLSADHEFMARLVSQRCRGRALDAPLARFRLGGMSSSRSLQCFAEDAAIALEHGAHPWLVKFMVWYQSRAHRRLPAAGGPTPSAGSPR